METDKREKSLADELYEKITSVIGGDNPNQFFYMGLPGTLIDVSQYTYDPESSAKKPWHVTANESRLVNKLFDACDVSASDDGRLLQTRHRDAPDIFTHTMNPDGGYTYPVSFNPQNWFELLDTSSFPPVDLLSSPAALAQQLPTLEMRRSNIITNLNQYLMIAPEEIAAGFKDLYMECETKFQNQLQQYTGNITDCTVDMLKTIVDIAAERGADGENKKIETEMPPAAIARIFNVDTTQINGLLDKLNGTVKECLSSQNELVQAAANTTEAALKWMEANNMVQLRQMIELLKLQLDDINEKIATLKEKINMAIYAQPEIQQKDVKQNALDESGEGKGDDKAPEEKKQSVMPNQVLEHFTQIVIDSKMSQVKQKSQHASDTSESSYGVSFFFGGYTSNSSHQSAVDDALKESADMEIQIGMSVAKVQIEREWYDPGVFMLTSDMYNTSSERSALGGEYQEFNQERLNEMNKCFLPCVPVSFVIARDVTIQFYSQSAISSSFAKTVEEHSAKGGGFFIFGGSSSPASSSSERNSFATSSANRVTVRFTSPQILGYYLEAVPADKSVSIADGAE